MVEISLARLFFWRNSLARIGFIPSRNSLNMNHVNVEH